jgi:hypothetical protein
MSKKRSAAVRRRPPGTRSDPTGALMKGRPCGTEAFVACSVRSLGERPVFFPPLLRGGQGGWSRRNQAHGIQRGKGMVLAQPITGCSKGLIPPASSQLLAMVSKFDESPRKQGGATAVEVVADRGCVRQGQALTVSEACASPPLAPLDQGGERKCWRALSRGVKGMLAPVIKGREGTAAASPSSCTLFLRTEQEL